MAGESFWSRTQGYDSSSSEEESTFTPDNVPEGDREIAKQKHEEKSNSVWVSFVLED
jgi:hypothetical protein